MPGRGLRISLLLARLLIGLAFMAASFWWAYSTWHRSVELGKFLEFEQEDLRELYQAINASGGALKVPPGAEPMLLVASIYGLEYFPPEDQEAAKWAARALHYRPLESGLWVVLANHLFFSGQVEHARTALARADELDPNYPLQRLEAIRLWTLMGERSRAGILAAQIGRLGNRERSDAAKELLRAGWERAEIFTRFEGGNLELPEMVELLELLKTSDRRQCHDLIAAIPPERLEASRGLRAVVSRHAVDARLLDQIEMLWRMDRPDAPTVPRFPADHVDLQLVFESVPLAMGWQGPPAENWVLLRRRVIDEPPFAGRPGQSTEGIEVQYRDTPDESRRLSRWTFYRVPVPENEELHVTLRVRTIPSDRSAAKVVAFDGQRRVESNTTDLRTDLFQELKLTMPAVTFPRVVSLQLDRTRARSIFDTEAELIVQSFQITTAPPPAAGEEVEP